MKHRKRRKGSAERFWGMLLAVVMVLSLAPENALALAACAEEAAAGLCEHHRSHTTDCGYREAAPCTHEHTDECHTEKTSCIHVHNADCYGGELPAEGEDREAAACTHVCTEDSGCVTKELNCTHEHDGSCGYAEAAPCGYVCKICPVQELIDALPDAEEITAENAADVEERLAGIDKAKEELTDEELDALDTIRYEAIVSALLALKNMAGADVPELLAENLDVTAGNVVISADGDYTITGTTTTNTITVNSGVNANITLSNVSIDVSGTEGAAAFKIADDSAGNVIVTLEGTNVLKSGADCAGLQKNGETGVGILIITGSGSLNAVGGGNGAGIGGSGTNSRNDPGGSTANIIIENGTITAQGGADTVDTGYEGYSPEYGGAGIGGGANGNGSNITITGGTVNATGGTISAFGGAGIGGGYNGSGTVTIRGSADVTARGAAGAAGIGSGCCASIGTNPFGTVTIEGGTVIATVGANPGYSGGCGAGIGAGLNSHANVTINGGTVTATGGSSGRGSGGAGIGSSGTFGNTTVKISGGTVKTKGGDDIYGGAGIGGGSSSGYAANVTITGGVVTATGGSDITSDGIGGPGAGIGLNAGGSGSATFSTTGDSGTGDAFIIAIGGTGTAANGDGITGDVTSAGNGLIVNGETTIWGAAGYNLSQDVEIPSGATLTISDGKTLILGNGATLTNHGTLNNQGILTIARGGALSGNTLTGSGTFRTENLTEDMISVPGDLLYNGSDLTGIISGQIRLAVICGQAFEVTGWTPEVTKADDLHYTVTCTHTDGRKVTKTVTVKPRPLTISGAVLSDKVYDGTAAAAVDSVTFTGYAEGDGELTTGDYTATAEFTDASAGKGKTATVTVTLKDTEAAGNYTLSSPVTSATGTINSRTVAAPTIELSPGSFVWDGTEKKPAVTVKDGDTIIPDSEYTVTYADNINAGTATVTVTDNEDGNYIVGRVSETFIIEKASQEEPVSPPVADTDPETENTPAEPEAGTTPAEPETGTTPANPGTGTTPANLGTGTIPARPGTGTTPARPETGTIPVRPGTGNTAGLGSFSQETVTDTGKPFIRGEYGRIGWDLIRAEEEKAAEGSVISVDMNGATVVPGEIFDSIRGRNITITFDMDNGIIWSVDGKGITRDASRDKAGGIDFSVKTGTDTIPADIIGNVAGESRSIQISLAHEGEFGFTAVLSINLGRENAGYAASLYYYNESTGRLEFICRDTITEDGTASFAFTHASDYLIAMDGEESGAAREPAQPENPDESSATAAGETPDKDSAAAAVESPETAQAWRPWWIAAAGILVMVVGTGLFFAVKGKKEEDDA